MIIKKFTNGFVVQIWDVEKQKWIKQEFGASSSGCEYENENGEICDPADMTPNVKISDMKEPYLPFDMVQPE